MGILEILIVGIGLAMDAFAVSICKGLSIKEMNWKIAAKVGAYFGGFQALMPVIGYLLGSSFSNFVSSVDHWIAFVLLLLIGGNMVKESFDAEDEKKNDDFSVKTMLGLAIATSIDALAVGITFAFFKVNLILAVVIIGIVTFLISGAGVKIGNKFGDKYQNKAELLGGCILILLGIKILCEHMGWLFWAN